MQPKRGGGGRSVQGVATDGCGSNKDGKDNGSSSSGNCGTHMCALCVRLRIRIVILDSRFSILGSERKISIFDCFWKRLPQDDKRNS